MSDVDLQKFTDDFTKKMESLVTNVESVGKKVEKVAADTENVKSRIETLKKEEAIDDNEDELLLDEDAKIEKLVDKKIQTARQEGQREQEYLQECAKWDSKAYEELPELKSNKEFEAEVQKEMNSMPAMAVKDGKKFFYPDAVYNAAHRVFSRWVKTGKVPPEPQPEDVDFGSFRPTVKGQEITDIQAQIAQNLGLDEKRAKEIYKPWNEQKIKKARSQRA